MSFQNMSDLSTLPQLIDEQFYVFILNDDATFSYCNERFAMLLNESKDSLIGKHYSSLPLYFENEPFSQPKWERQEPKTIRITNRSGHSHWLFASEFPIVSKEENIRQYLYVATNITKEREKYNEAKQLNIYLKQIEEALHQSSIVSITDSKGVITYVNEKLCEISQYDESEIIGKTHRLFSSNYHSATFFYQLWKTIQSGKQWQGNLRNKAKDGRFIWLNTTIIPFLDENGIPYQYIAIQNDITKTKEVEASLEVAMRNDFRQTVKHLQNIIFKYEVKDPLSIEFTMVEGQFLDKLGIKTIDLNGFSLLKKFKKQQRFFILRNLMRAARGEQVEFELEYEQHTILIYLSPIFQEDIVKEVVGTGIDITQRKKAEETIAFMAYYDSLTKLPNRQLLQQLTNEKITQGEGFALLFIDLDRFKSVNDSMGHLTGDQLLISVGERLKRCVRDNDIVARLSGDEFVVILSLEDEELVRTVTQRIVTEISLVFPINSYDIYVTPSIGISLYPKDGTTYEELLQHADAAMYLAKNLGKNNFQFFTDSLRKQIKERKTLEHDLRKALMYENFSFYYQPIWNVKKNEIIAIQSKVMWDHPFRGKIEDQRFVPLAENAGLILPLGMWMIRRACIQIKMWQDVGYKSLPLSIHISNRLLDQPFFVSKLLSMLKEIELDPRHLLLELDGAFLTSMDGAQEVMEQLDAHGIRLIVNQFGSGGSSFDQLPNWPISKIKIDDAFLQSLNATNRIIVRSMVELAHQLHLPLLVDRVDTKQQADFLDSTNCSIRQGNFYEEPLSNKEFARKYLEPTFHEGS